MSTSYLEPQVDLETRNCRLAPLNDPANGQYLSSSLQLGMHSFACSTETSLDGPVCICYICIRPLRIVVIFLYENTCRRDIEWITGGSEDHKELPNIVQFSHK